PSGFFRPGRGGRARPPAGRRHGAHAQARLRADRRGGRRARALRRSRHAAGLFRRGRPPRRHAELRPRRARRAQPHRRAGADRGICLDNGRPPRRRRHGRCVRRPRDRDFSELSMRAPLQAKMPQPLPPAQAQGAGTDPVTTEIVRNGLIAATEEMKTNLMRTAYNMIIYEALDFTVGLFDARGNTVSIGLGLPMFIRGMSDTVKAKLAHYGLARLDPGDILLTNDAYITGSHLYHMTFTVPVFWEGDVVAFSCCMAHWPDVGGTLDGATTDIFSEGLQMPIVKIYRKGVPNDELIELIKMNVRLPERAMGDFRAQVAAVKTGERRFLEMLQKYGRDAVLGGIAAIMDHSEARARAQVAAIPDGVYEAESFMDDDGVKIG